MSSKKERDRDEARERLRVRHVLRAALGSLAERMKTTEAMRQRVFAEELRALADQYARKSDKRERNALVPQECDELLAILKTVFKTYGETDATTIEQRASETARRTGLAAWCSQYPELEPDSKCNATSIVMSICGQGHTHRTKPITMTARVVAHIHCYDPQTILRTWRGTNSTTRRSSSSTATTRVKPSASLRRTRGPTHG